MIRRAATILIAGLLTVGAARAASAEAPAAAAPDGPAPRIAFDVKDLNLGDVTHGQDAVATFTYHNTGTAPLHILSAKPG
jgi:hypothetical protein